MPEVVFDPCAEAEKVRLQIHSLMTSGGGVSEITNKGAGGQQTVKFSQATTIKLTDLRAYLNDLIDQCREAQGLPRLRRRFAFTAGSRRTPTGIIG